MPKNAGTTINGILKGIFAKENIFHVRNNKQGVWNLNEFRGLPQEEKNNIYLLTGHFNFGLHKHFTEKYDYITMLRHPVERTVSFYNYVKRQKKHRLLDAVRGKSLIECITQVKDFDVVNGQARKLSNTNDEDKMLDSALKNIEKHFKFVGIQEYFDESILLLNEKLDLGIKSYTKLNSAKSKPQVDKELIRAIENTNQVDLKLYSILKEKFLQEISAIENKAFKLNALKHHSESTDI